MAHGREVRLPFLDHKLVELIFSLPANFKIHEGWTKWLPRNAVDKNYPLKLYSGKIKWATSRHCSNG
jgi:asparagine synthase (glutamine-hydrolysing)